MDCGCGRAFLTLAAYHYLREKRGLSVQLTGVDADAEVIARASELRDRLGYEEVQFARSRILEYEPPERSAGGVQPSRVRHGHGRGDRARGEVAART